MKLSELSQQELIEIKKILLKDLEKVEKQYRENQRKEIELWQKKLQKYTMT